MFHLVFGKVTKDLFAAQNYKQTCMGDTNSLEKIGTILTLM